jgi:hypothetical protein
MFAGYCPHSESTGMNIISIQNRLNRAVAKMPPPPITRESIDASLRSLGLNVDATWRFICTEQPTRVRLEQLVNSDELFSTVAQYQ